MKSHLTKSFRKAYSGLPQDIRKQARKTYKLWIENSHHSSLHFKQVSSTQPIYSVRIGIGYRALGLVENSEIYWFWIGPHAEYDHLLKRL